MKVTMKSIADKVGVSVNTVSLALRGMPGVRAETRGQILQMAKELGYVGTKGGPEAKNLYLLSTAERLLDSYFYMSFYQIILSKVQGYGYNLLVHHTGSMTTAEAFRHSLKVNSIGGIIVLGDIEEETVAKAAGCGVPLVALGTRFHRLPVCTFIEDNLEGAYQAVEHLHQRGYRRIGFIGQPLYSTAFMERYLGFLGAMRQFGLENQPHYNMLDYDNEMRYDAGHMAQNIQGMEAVPEAFVCANDNLALTAAKAFHSLDIRIPEDVALIGFDNSTSGKMSIPSLTSVDVCCEQQAEVSVKKLMELMERPQEARWERYTTPTQLVEGDSVGGR